jgi:alanine-synthesizing transaminase
MFSDRTNWKLGPNRLSQALEQVRAAGAKILDLTASNPTRIGLEYDSQTILKSLASPRSLDYDPQSTGLKAARESVAHYYANQHRVSVDPEHIVLTTSTSEAYSHIFRLLCNAGDELLVPKPSYPLLEFLADLQDVKLVAYPLLYDHGWQIDFHSLQKAVTPRTRGVVLVHPNNPTGSYVKAGEVEVLNAFSRDHRLALIVDEVFLDYSLETPVCSFADNQAALSFTLSGLSKISALPQMKVAWVVASGPADQVSAALGRLEVIADTYLSMNGPIQWALPDLLDERSRIQPQLLHRVQSNLAELDRLLALENACQRLAVEGGWYAVLRVPVTRSDEDLTIALLREKSVLVLSLIPAPLEFSEGIGRILDFLR